MTITQSTIDKWKSDPSTLSKQESEAMHKYLIRRLEQRVAVSTSVSAEFIPDNPDDILAEMARHGIDFQDSADFVHETIKPPHWIIPDLIAQGMKGDLFGKSKSRKTFFGLQLANAVCHGEPFLKWSIPQPHKVAYFNLELMPYFMQERMKMQARGMSHSPGQMLIFNMRGKASQLRDHIGLISKFLQLKGIELAVIDPRYKLLQDGEDENTAAGLRSVLEMRDRLLDSCAVLLIGHDPKGDVSQKQKTDRGAGSYTAAADHDFAFFLTPHADGNEDHVVVSTTNRNRRAIENFTAEFVDETLSFSVNESLAPTTVKAHTKSMTPAERAQRNAQQADAFKAAALEVAMKAGNILLGTDAFKENLQKTPAGAAIGVNAFDKKFNALIDNGVLARQLEQERMPNGCHKNKHHAKTLISTPELIQRYLSQFNQ